MSKEPQIIEALFSKLVSANEIVFPEKREPLNAPKLRGIYIIQMANGTVLHVGNTPRGKEGIYQRLQNHLRGKSSFARSFLEGNGSILRGTHYFKYLEVSDARQRALLEAYAIGKLCPKHIGIG